MTPGAISSVRGRSESSTMTSPGRPSLRAWLDLLLAVVVTRAPSCISGTPRRAHQLQEGKTVELPRRIDGIRRHVHPGRCEHQFHVRPVYLRPLPLIMVNVALEAGNDLDLARPSDQTCDLAMVEFLRSRARRRCWR